MPRPCTLSCVVLLCLLAACTDASSNVGVGLLEEGNEPEVREVTPTAFEEIPLRDYTGATPRVLAGKVSDPVAGAITTTGYIDFSGGLSANDTSPITGVELHLARDYRYGDTTAMVTLNLLDIPEDWSASGRKADTSLTLGQMAASFSFEAHDTLVVAPLPEPWIQAHQETLRSADFDSLFHGFAMEAVTGETVVGFSSEGSSLRITTEQDTTTLNLSRTLTRITRDTEPTPPEGYVLLQDGAGPAARLDFDLDAFHETPINGAFLLVYADLEESSAAPPNFARPSVETLQLVAVTDPEDPAVLVATVQLSEEGDYRFVGADIGNYFQSNFFGLNSFEYLELRPPVADHTINSILLHNTSSGDKAPGVLFVLTP